MVQCSSCGRTFAESATQAALIHSGNQKGMPVVMLSCSLCGRGFLHHLAPAGASSARAAPVCRCPGPHCAGWVNDLSSIPDEENKWGCGECGRTWLDDRALDHAIDEIVRRYPHRESAYTCTQGARWLGVPLADQPKDYEEVIETEDWE